MDFLFKNKIKHLVILIFSTLLLYPLVNFLNLSYYTTISKVNYWEEKSIVSLVKYILTNTEKEKINLIKPSLENINYFDIKINNGDEMIIHKPLKNHSPNLEQMNEYEVENYKIIITRRKYDSTQDDFSYYLSAWKSPSKLLGNRTFTVFLGHLAIFLFLELIWIVFSIQFRLNQLQKSIKRNLN